MLFNFLAVALSSCVSSPLIQLRKLIRTKRVESIEQYGMDRVVDFTFGSGELTCHLIVEFYAAVRPLLPFLRFHASIS